MLFGHDPVMALCDEIEERPEADMGGLTDEQREALLKLTPEEWESLSAGPDRYYSDMYFEMFGHWRSMMIETALEKFDL